MSVDDKMEINNELIEKWEPKIYRILKNAYIEGWEKEDLVQELRLTIIKAAKKYNPEKNTIFHTYLHTAMINTLRTIHSKSLKRISTISLDKDNTSGVADNDNYTLKDVLTIDDKLLDEVKFQDFLNSLNLDNSETNYLTMKSQNYTMDYIQDNLMDTSVYKVKKSLRKKYKEKEE